MGKTGVFLHLGYLLWRLVGSPDHTTPAMDSVQRVDLELEAEEEEEKEDLLDPQFQQKYPVYDHICSMSLRRPEASRTYGDPNEEAVLAWYMDGNRGPHPSVKTTNNKTVRKANVMSSGDTERNYTTEYVYSKYAARPLQKYSGPRNYDVHTINENGLEGRLLINKDTSKSKWTFIRGYPTLWKTLQFPPIIIPSSGRPTSGLFDLRPAMEGRTNYVQILVIREEEEEDYLQHLMSDNNIDVFVMNSSTPGTVGAARWTAKKLAEIITNFGLSSNFCFLLDDNIISWKAVTLINDPDPPIEDVEPSDERSQRTDISLVRLMDYCSNENINKHQLHKFSIIGFSMGSRQNVNNIRIAFGRQHLFAAVFLNMKKLRDVEYNTLAWAMEDIKFNKSTDEKGGVLVKCRRFLAQKKRLNHGGVMAENEGLLWFKPFSEKRREWIDMLRSSDFSERRELISLCQWSSALHNSGDGPTQNLISSINRVVSGSGCDPQLRNRISKLVELLGRVETSLTGDESNHQKDEIIRQIFGEESPAQPSPSHPSAFSLLISEVARKNLAESSRNKPQNKTRKRTQPQNKSMIKHFFKHSKN